MSDEQKDVRTSHLCQSIEEILGRIARIPNHLGEIREGIRKAVLIAEIDPGSALMRARSVMEHIVCDVFRCQFKEDPAKRPLDNLLQRLVRGGFIDDRMDAYTTAVRKLGNIGAHSLRQTVSIIDVLQSLNQLLLIIDWFVEEQVLGREQSQGLLAPPVRPTTAADQVTVAQLADYKSPELIAALSLYNRRIPQSERFHAEDIVRWIRNSRGAGVGDPRPTRDYVFVAKLLSRVCGFTLIHYSPAVRIAFIAYLVADKGVAVQSQTITAALFKSVTETFSQDQSLNGCEAFLLEVDDPRQVSGKERRRQLARIDLFCTIGEQCGIPLRALDIDYRQPHLYIPAECDEGKECRLLLMCASKQVGSTIERGRVLDVLAYIYQGLYPEDFSDCPIDTARYREYLDRLHAKQTAALPEVIKLLRFKDVRERSTIP